MDRFRLFTIVTYLDKDILHNIVSNHSNIRNYAYIFHNNDYKNNKLIEPHFHLLLRLTNACTASAVQKYFPIKPNTFVQFIKSDTIYNYLTHEGYGDKCQYNENDIISNDISFWQRLTVTDDKEQKTVQLINDIIDGVDLYTMLCTYGRDFVINYDKYVKFARLLPNPKNQLTEEELNDNALRCINECEAIAKAFDQMPILQCNEVKTKE